MGRRAKVAIPEPPKAAGGGWITTFADLMSLLMAFFVLLYAMSEVDKHKFEEFGKSMKDALGKPSTIEAPPDITKPEMKEMDAVSEEKQKLQDQMTSNDAEALRGMLKQQVADNQIEINQKGNIIVISMLQKGVFSSGSANIVNDFKPTLLKLREKMKTMKGDIIVSGHTDDVPVSGHNYRSNWELSAARAYSVIDQLIKEEDMDETRFVLRGYGDTRPKVPNTSAENRAQNRRVEIMIDQRLSLPDEADQDKDKEGAAAGDDAAASDDPAAKGDKPIDDKKLAELQATADKVLEEKQAM